mmetsp:Transcript_34918/g.51386  ORF Transcript_34918/g.51386 Transcript_34918/m.51386 type:complete len:97 (-) Transcript_34918:20-310(-)
MLLGCWNKILSRNSAACFLQNFLCCDQSFFWHLILQYRTDLQAVHIFNLMSSPSEMPQEAQHNIATEKFSSNALITYQRNKHGTCINTTCPRNGRP